jgi:hypothetical protein
VNKKSESEAVVSKNELGSHLNLDILPALECA